MSADVQTPQLGPIAVATVTVPDLDVAASAYTEWLGYEAWHDGEVSPSLAVSWLAPHAAGSRYRLVGPGRGSSGGVRLVERPRPAVASPLRVAGWRSLELAVSDVEEVRRRLESSPFEIVGEPKGLDFNPEIRAMQAVGPGGEMLYLTQTTANSGFDLPIASRLVDRMFIAVLSTPSIERSYAFYRERFGALGSLRTLATPLEAVNRVLDFPLDRAHPLVALQLAGKSLVEIDGHPDELIDERPPVDDLPSGLASVTFDCAELDKVASLLGESSRAIDDPPYLGARAATLCGPAGERVELLERARAG